MGKQLLSVFWEGGEREREIRLTSTDPNSDQWVAHQLYWHEGGSIPIEQDNSAGPLIKFIMKFNEKCIPLRQLAVWYFYFLDYANKKSTSKSCTLFKGEKPLPGFISQGSLGTPCLLNSILGICICNMSCYFLWFCDYAMEIMPEIWWGI